jgi:pyruvate/2-oxoglutarate dehydrogenase complex dihydrolipoamide acyltransferase (E2) component
LTRINVIQRWKEQGSASFREMTMPDIEVDEALWASSMLPEGVVERWFIADGALVKQGEPIAQIRIEDALHEIMAPAHGRLKIVLPANSIVEPGSLLAQLTVDETP